MQLTSNYQLKKPEGTDVVNIDDFNTNADIMDNALKVHDTQLSDMLYQTAGGSATAITLTIKGTLVNGYPITFVASANNSGAVTTINGKKLYKPGTTISPTLIAGKAYTVWYNLSGDCFFIKASAEGDADISHVLATKKFSNDNDTGLTGTMSNNGAVNQSLAINGSYTIPKGYHDGTGKVIQTIATKAEATITPGTVNQIISANQFLTGIQTILGDSDLIASNIISTANIFGIQGSATIASLGGKRVAASTFVQAGSLDTTIDGISTTGTFYTQKAGFHPNQITGAFDFVPRIVIIYSPSYQELTVYTPAGYDKYYSGPTVKTCRYDTTGSNYNIKGDTQGFGVYYGGFRLPCNTGSIGRTVYWIAIE